MKHYTFSLLTLAVAAFGLHGCLNAQSPSSYSLYNNCNEYYDSRGFYHKECDENKFSKRKLKKAYKSLTDDVDPGTGVEDNTTKPSKLASTIDDIIEDTTPEDPTIKGEGKNSDTSTPAIPERPELEFGREGN